MNMPISDFWTEFQEAAEDDKKEADRRKAQENLYKTNRKRR